jgi:hypothetical protein
LTQAYSSFFELVKRFLKQTILTIGRQPAPRFSDAPVWLRFRKTRQDVALRNFSDFWQLLVATARAKRARSNWQSERNEVASRPLNRTNL